MENQFNCQPKIFKTDGEKALDQAFTEYCESKGIIVEVSVPHTSSQNGAAERAGCTIIEKARAMMIDSQLPKTLWPEAYKAATYLINCTPTYTPIRHPDGTQCPE